MINAFFAIFVSTVNKKLFKTGIEKNNAKNAVKYQITLDNNVYPASIADNTTGTPDYNIKRNYAYTTIGTYAPASEATVTLEWKVKEYTDVSVDVPTFE